MYICTYILSNCQGSIFIGNFWFNTSLLLQPIVDNFKGLLKICL